MNKFFGKSRTSLRRRDHDYSRAGFYFVTINTFEKINLFGGIVNGSVSLNKFGKIAQEEWLRTPKVRRNVALDDFVIMPNHLHGIIIIRYLLKKPHSVAVDCNQPPLDDNYNDWRRQSNNLPAVIRGFKGAVTKKINSFFQENDHASVWQRSYHDRIIRNNAELNAIRRYMRLNPANFEADTETP